MLKYWLQLRFFIYGKEFISTYFIAQQNFWQGNDTSDENDPANTIFERPNIDQPSMKNVYVIEEFPEKYPLLCTYQP